MVAGTRFFFSFFMESEISRPGIARVIYLIFEFFGFFGRLRSQCVKVPGRHAGRRLGFAR